MVRRVVPDSMLLVSQMLTQNLTQEKEASRKRISESERSERAVNHEYSYNGRRRNVIEESQNKEEADGRSVASNAEEHSVVDKDESNAEEQADGNQNKQEETPKQETVLRRNAWTGGKEGQEADGTDSVSQKPLLSQTRVPWAGQGVIRERKFPWEIAQAKHMEEMELREQRQRENERANLLERVAMLAKYKWAKEEDVQKKQKQKPIIARPRTNSNGHLHGKHRHHTHQTHHRRDHKLHTP